MQETVGFEQLVTELKWRFVKRLQEMAALSGFVLSEYTLLEMGPCDCEYPAVHCVAYLKTFQTHEHFPILNWVEGS